MSSPTGVQYRTVCVKSERCPTHERVAAVYDYVGAVYGDQERIQYDGLLTATECSYVVSTFGPLSTTVEVSTYISTAQQKFLHAHRRDSVRRYCSESKHFHVGRVKHKQLGEAFFLGGLHHCGDQFGEMYTNGIELDVAASPQAWVFLIEDFQDVGTANVDQDRKNADEEYLLFTHIAQVLRIPRYSSVVSQHSAPVLAELAKQGITDEEFAVAWTFNCVNEGRYLEHVSKSNEGFLIDVCARFYAGAFLFDPHTFREAVRIFSQQPDHEQRLKKIGEEAVDASNKLSATEVRAIVSQHKGKKYFFQFGVKHQPIVEEVFGKHARLHPR